MTVALKIRIRDLLPEFLADALILFRTLKSAGAVTAGALQALFDGGYQFFIFVEPNSHT